MFAVNSCCIITAVLFGMAVTGFSNAGILVDGGMTQQQVAQPGERYRGTFILRNTDAVSMEAKVFQTDYAFAADGSNTFGEPGRSARSNAPWVRLSRELVTIPANGTERIDYEVSVPAGQGAALTGTYWSLIMVEPIGQTSQEAVAPPELAPGEERAQIGQMMRYALQVITHIGKTGTAGLNFTNPQLLQRDGKQFFAIDVENTGERLLGPNLTLELYRETGEALGKFSAGGQRLFPGTAFRFQMDLSQVPKGKYLGLVVADGTGDNLFGANVELEIE
jgi:hypothetical protein